MKLATQMATAVALFGFIEVRDEHLGDAHRMARSPNATPSSWPSEMVVRAMRRAGAWQLRARLWRPRAPPLERTRYTAACRRPRQNMHII